MKAHREHKGRVNDIAIHTSHLFRDEAELIGEPHRGFVNNAVSQLPLLIYKRAILLPQQEPVHFIQKVLSTNDWKTGQWEGEVYDYHHYHSLAHEVLVCFHGRGIVRVGGDMIGETFEIGTGDVLVIPAGVAHKRLSAAMGFKVVAAYPTSNPEPDMNYGKDGERPKADENIARVPLPSTDPIFGANGPLAKLWLHR